jgi:phosphohistidine phosphatase SixA
MVPCSSSARGATPVRLYVVRHAHAGERSAWDGHDDERPLTRKGRRQAAAISDALAHAGISRLVSSPTVRCIQTFEPLAARLGLAVELDGRLSEGTPAVTALALADELHGEPRAAAVCSHGDIVPELLRIWRATTVRFTGPLVWPKGSTWVISWAGDRWTTARYIPPPRA